VTMAMQRARARARAGRATSGYTYWQNNQEHNNERRDNIIENNML
jgi:hypothetical protein